MENEKEICCCRKKAQPRPPEETRRLVNRLNRMEGQIRGLKHMVEEDAYCVDIMTQAAAVSAAVEAFNRQLLETHLRTCVAQDIREGRNETMDELILLLRRITG